MAVLFEYRGGHALDLGDVREVGGVDVGDTTPTLDFVFEHTEFGSVARHQQHLGPGFGQLDRSRPADPRRSPRDHHDLPPPLPAAGGWVALPQPSLGHGKQRRRLRQRPDRVGQRVPDPVPEPRCDLADVVHLPGTALVMARATPPARC